MIPIGLATPDMARIEAGIGVTVPLKSRTDDLTGRAALERRKASPVRKLVGLDIGGGIVPASGDCIRLGRAQVDVTHADIGTELEVG